MAVVLEQIVASIAELTFLIHAGGTVETLVRYTVMVDENVGGSKTLYAIRIVSAV